MYWYLHDLVGGVCGPQQLVPDVSFSALPQLTVEQVYVPDSLSYKVRFKYTAIVDLLQGFLPGTATDHPLFYDVHRKVGSPGPKLIGHFAVIY